MNERINTVIRRLLIIDYKMSIYFVQSQYGQYRSGNKSRSFDRLEGAKAHEYLRVHKGLSFITTVTNDPDGEAVFIEVPDKFRKEVISEKNHRHYVKAAINKNISMLRSPYCTFALHNGNRTLVKRKSFEKYIAEIDTIDL